MDTFSILDFIGARMMEVVVTTGVTTIFIILLQFIPNLCILLGQAYIFHEHSREHI